MLARLSRTSYRVRELATGKTFERVVALMARCGSRGPNMKGTIGKANTATSPAREHKVLQTTSTVLAVLDAPGDKHVWLMRADKAEDGTVGGQYYNPSSTKVASAIFKLVWIEEGSGLAILGKLGRHERGEPWRGSVPDTSEFVLARDLQFRKNGMLTAASARTLSGFEAAMLV